MRQSNSPRIIGNLIARQLATKRVADTLLDENLQLKNKDSGLFQLVYKQKRGAAQIVCDEEEKKETLTKRDPPQPAQRAMSALPRRDDQ